MSAQRDLTLIYVLNGLGFSRGMPIGGADKRALEVGKSLENSGVKVMVLTTDAGKETLAQWGWPAKTIEVVRPSGWPKALENSLFGRLLSYGYVVLADLLMVGRITLDEKTIIYPTSDMFFDLLPAFFLKLRNRRAHLVGIVHHWIPGPLTRGGFSFSNTLIFIAQRLGFYFLKAADKIFVPKTLEGEKTRQVLNNIGINNNKIFEFLNGVNLEETSQASETGKIYSACFLGGFRPSKGIADLVPVWQLVQRQLSGAKLLLIGGGLSHYRDDLERWIKEAGLSDSIIIAGVLSQPKLYETVKKARILISPSREEGWGIAVLEALACGLPVVAYDLPAYTVFKDAVIKVKPGDTTGLAAAALRLLSHPEIFEKQRGLGLQIAGEFDWMKIAAGERYELENVLSAH